MKKSYFGIMSMAVFVLGFAAVAVAGELMYDNTLFTDDQIAYLKSARTEKTGDAQARTDEKAVQSADAKEKTLMYDNTLLTDDQIAYLEEKRQAKHNAVAGNMAGSEAVSMSVKANTAVFDNTLFDADARQYLLDVKEGRDTPKRPITNWMKQRGFISAE